MKRKFEILHWWIGSNGNYFADAKANRYCVAYNHGDGWRVAVSGYPIGKAETENAAKEIAQAHCDRR